MLFIWDFQITLKASVMIVASVIIKYLFMRVRVVAFRHLDTLSANLGSPTSDHLKSLIFGLGTYIFPVNVL